VFTVQIGAGHELRRYAVPLKARPHRVSVGLRPTDVLLLPGPDTPEQLAEKSRLLDEHGHELVAVLPGAESAAAVVAQQLTKADSLVAAALAVSEDICVMQRTQGFWQLTAAAVCFPSHWRPRDKLGRGLDAIHDPVPGYERIAAATDQAFDRIADNGGIWERFNWTLVADDVLCHLGPGEPPGQPIRAEDLWLRVERQVLSAVAEDLVVFLIRTFLTPLPALTQSERTALAESLSGVSDELAKYRSWVGYRDAVISWVGQ